MTMDFDIIKKAVQERYNKYFKGAKAIFQMNIDKDKIKEVYLGSFPDGTDPMFRETTEHDCSCCKAFLRNMGGVVALVDGKIQTLWDFTTKNEAYNIVAKALHDYVMSCEIESVYYSEFKQAGVNSNIERLESGESITWTHFHVTLDDAFVLPKKDIGTKRGLYNGTVAVFRRALEELTLDSLDVAVELIDGEVLPRGAEFRSKAVAFLAEKRKYDVLTTEAERLAFTWLAPSRLHPSVTSIRNSAFGTFLVDLSGYTKEDGTVVEPLDLDSALRKYEVVTCGENYKRTKTIYTKKQQEQAVVAITGMGLLESLPKRFAKLEDITVNNIMFCDRGVAPKVSGTMAILESMGKAVATDPKVYDKVEDISIKDFITNVLPHATAVEAMVENRHLNNMVSLIAPVNADSKNMFKWNNNFGWAYEGNIADVSMRENVAKAGGSVTGEVRCSMQWNEKGLDVTDLDLHMEEASPHTIYHGNKRRLSPNGGMLDVDIITPKGVAVENITYASISTMRNGTYVLKVKDFSGRGTKDGFRIEIEVLGDIHSFDIAPSSGSFGLMTIAKLHVKNGKVEVESIQESTNSPREIWGIHTQQFVPVHVIMNSPNFWDKQEGIGNEHYFFMLNDCVNPDTPNGFYNEFLHGDLHEHRKFFEALGSQMRVEHSEEQLSGVGFNTYKRNDLVVRVTGATKRVMRIKF